MKRIRQLPALIANQIAAGEVIERPASVVKELLENALDAKADHISIDIGFGGLNQIKISDNGMGILKEDLPLAVAAHATSKISQLSDLYAIDSLGFRGEALASIASISRLTIISKPAEQDHAMKLSVINQSLELTPCARSQGTTIDVRDIFFNAPVRKKFLKSERSEFQAIELVVKRFAMSAPAVALQLSHNGKLIMKLPAVLNEQTELARISKLLGKEFLANSIYREANHADLQLRGWFSKPDYQRNQNDKQWVYINGRMVKDKLVNHAVKQAYEQILYPGKHPACLLYLTIDPAEIDVNVHPTKHELRFQQPRLVHDFITSQLQEALELSKPVMNYPLQVQEQSAWELKEVNQPRLAAEPVYQSQISAENMIAVDERYRLFTVGNQVYLADFIAIQNHWLQALLFKQALPLKSRPLLVPVHYYHANGMDEKERQPLSELLAQTGLHIEWLGGGECLLRSLPIIAPHLMIKPFLDEIFYMHSPSIPALLKAIARHQSPPNDLNQPDFMHYLGNHAAELSLSTSFCKPLLAEQCREWLHG